METLTIHELINLVRSVFSPGKDDRRLAILIDVPDEKVADIDKWRMRREMASEWHGKLREAKTELQLSDVDLVFYPNVHSNNADLPKQAFRYNGSAATVTAGTLLSKGIPFDFAAYLDTCQIILAPTQFSATAPLKLLAKKSNFRAATMPGFTAEMIPSLRLDYEEINRRVFEIKKLLDKADSLDVQFLVDGKQEYTCHFDLRFRTAHASGGRLPDPGTAGNLPSGESYIVPYEGEQDAASESSGVLPVQFDDEVVLYRLENNTAKEVISRGARSDAEAKYIASEPAYANIAELGFGVLKDFGVLPSGEILLDEKLGLHIAFGRSDHFGGAVGAANFTSIEKVVHIDRIYIPETQPRIHIEQVILNFKNEKSMVLMKNNGYTIF
ncbi:MAG: hypothetical protein ACOY90_17175 [Candidatus Zhuqueibacterota bacterium]